MIDLTREILEFLLGLVVAWIAFFVAELMDRMICYNDYEDENERPV